MCRRVTRGGASLIEALVALALVTVTMTVGMALLAQESAATRRVKAHQEAMAIVETTIESVRAGVTPMASGRVELPVTWTEADAMTLWLEVTPRDQPPELSEVVVEARYVVGPFTLRRSVRTMVWGAP